MQENEPIVNPKPVEDNMETGSSDQDKVLKKPDKILQCPRCNSMDTKFCYFNNYNVNQPRHFCKNCQRYWTAGGTMRNVPIGAGRRKNKHLASQYQHIIVTSDGIPASRLETTDSSGLQQQHIASLESIDLQRGVSVPNFNTVQLSAEDLKETEDSRLAICCCWRPDESVVSSLEAGIPSEVTIMCWY